MQHKMKNRVFIFFWMAMLAFVSAVVGIFAISGLFNAEVIFWTNKPIESKGGKIAWIMISIITFIVFLALGIRAYRNQEGRVIDKQNNK
jgi:ABC-type microcin C transport system permease subunit YejE